MDICLLPVPLVIHGVPCGTSLSPSLAGNLGQVLSLLGAQHLPCKTKSERCLRLRWLREVRGSGARPSPRHAQAGRHQHVCIAAAENGSRAWTRRARSQGRNRVCRSAQPGLPGSCRGCWELARLAARHPEPRVDSSLASGLPALPGVELVDRFSACGWQLGLFSIQEKFFLAKNDHLCNRR